MMMERSRLHATRPDRRDQRLEGPEHGLGHVLQKVEHGPERAGDRGRSPKR